MAHYLLKRLPQADPGWGYVLIKSWWTLSIRLVGCERSCEN